MEQRRQARLHLHRRLQQAGVLDLHRPRHAHRGHRVEEDRCLSEVLRLGLRHARGGADPFHARAVLVLQTDMWAVAFLNGPRMVSIPLAKTGDSDRRRILSEYTLVACNEKSSGGCSISRRARAGNHPDSERFSSIPRTCRCFYGSLSVR